MKRLKHGLRALFEHAENTVEGIFGPDWNPLRQLGAIGWLLFWTLAITGIYLYVFFDTGVAQAYESVEALTHEQWWAGGIMRSFHRYASDALVLVVVLHLLREFAFDRLRGPRWFAWITGLVSLAFVYVCGITGYWMVWDQLAQYIAITTSEWLDRLPFFAEPIARNFLGDEYLSGRFFTLMAYVHIFAPLAMLLVMWIHIARYTEARITPTRGLMYGTVGMLLVVSMLFPAVSQGPADLDRVATDIGLDWFYLPIYPLIDRWGGTAVWGLVLSAGIFLSLLPWMPRLERAPPAVVNLDNCNGCGRCVADCPFGAISLVPRADGEPFAQQAEVRSDHCVSCGICVGACPTATPFRRATALLPGIELPDSPVAQLRATVVTRAAKLEGPRRVVAFVCKQGAQLAEGPSVAAIEVPCAGMVPPSFLDFVLARSHADGVMLAGCRQHSSYHRLGDRWTEQRIAATRDPRLRERVPRERVATSWAGPGQVKVRKADLEAFQGGLGPETPTAGEGSKAWHRGKRPGFRLWTALAQTATYAFVAASLAYCSISPRHALLGEDQAVITFSFSHAGERKQECKQLTAEEMASLPPNMRRPQGCARERWPVEVELLVDGALIYAGQHASAGLWDDGPSTVYRNFSVPAGPTTLTVRLRDSGRTEGFDFVRSADLELAEGQRLVVDFHKSSGFTIH